MTNGSRRKSSTTSLSPGEFLSSLAAAARENPLPAALFGLGALWVLGRDAVEASASDDDDVPQRKTKSRKGSRRGHTTRQRIVETAAAAEQGFGELWEEQPLLVGAMGLAVGAGLGVLLPTTHIESEVLGPQAEALAAETKSFVAEKAAQARDFARNVGTK
jgi:hypothetical protein